MWMTYTGLKKKLKEQSDIRITKVKRLYTKTKIIRLSKPSCDPAGSNRWSKRKYSGWMRNCSCGQLRWIFGQVWITSCGIKGRGKYADDGCGIKGMRPYDPEIDGKDAAYPKKDRTDIGELRYR